MGAAQRWRGRVATAEALALLALARLLVARVPLARWRATLGEPATAEPADVALRRDDNLVARRLARAVQRAAARLPGESLCLPQAVALQWAMRWRGLSGTLHVGVRPRDERSGSGDLHAWVVRRGEVLIGASDERHHALFVVRNAGRND